MDLTKFEYQDVDGENLVEFVETMAVPCSDEKETGISYKTRGQIFISDKGMLNFTCAHCGRILITINEFSMHLKYYHDLENWIFENEGDCVRDEICSENEINYSDDAECTNSDYKEIEDSNFTHFDQIDHQFDSNDECDEDGCDKQEISNITSTKERPDNLNVKDNGVLNVNVGGKIQKKVLSKLDCEYCGRYCNTQQNLELHILTFHQEAKEIKYFNTDIVCTVCNKNITSEASMANHKALCSSDYFHENRTSESGRNDDDSAKQKSKTYKCKYCDRKFSIPSERKIHEYTHTREKPFKCEICSKTFRKKSQYRHHLMAHKNIRPHKCDICNSSFTLRTNLVVHKRRHTGEKRFQCEYCDKTFVSSVEKKIHERYHTGVKPYKCNFCSKNFFQSTQLSFHTQKYHFESKSFKCEKCNKEFCSPYKLKYHAAIHEEKKFECEICGAKLLRKQHLGRHMKVHENKKAFLCSICGKTFNHKNGLTTHMKVHRRNENTKNKNCS